MTHPTYHSMKPKTVYFIRPIGMEGPIKIGASDLPVRRRSDLECWCPFPLEIIAEIPGNHWIERQFHCYFAEESMRREWFRWSPRLQATIDAINAGAFDVATLPPPTRQPSNRSRRDLSYLTPGWRYQRSVEHRVLTLRRQGLPGAEVDAAGIYEMKLDHADDATIEAAKAHCEPLIADWQARFPKRSLAA